MTKAVMILSLKNGLTNKSLRKMINFDDSLQDGVLFKILINEMAKIIVINLIWINLFIQNN